MAMVLIQNMDGVTLDQYDEVNAKLGVDDDPPAGLIVHTASPRDGGVRIVDVWESEDAWQRFREERLLPVVHEVFGEQAGPPHQETHETHKVIKP
jgi:hypothetical protein